MISPYTSVSMTTADVHHDEKIYTDAKKFVPERWLGDSPKALNDESLEKYFVTLAKGREAVLELSMFERSRFVLTCLC